MANNGFFMRDAYLTRTAKLSDEELGRLFRACMIYHATGEIVELQDRESIAFDFIKEDIDEQTRAYEAKCETNRRNRNGTIDNDRQRPSTTVIDPQPDATAVHKVKVKVKEKVKVNKEDDLSEREETERFERFWEAYPRHENRQKAQAAFTKLHPDEAMLGSMILAIEKQKATDQWQEDGGRYIPHPTTWLNGRRWEDEPPKATGKATRTVIAQQYSQRDYSGQEESVDEMMERLMSINGQNAG